MLQNLQKLKEIQRQQAIKAQEEEKILDNAFQLISNQQSLQIPQPKDLQICCSAAYITIFQKNQLEEMEQQINLFIESINQLSKYNNLSFVQYLGIQVHEELPQPKRNDEQKISKKEIQKKVQKSQSPIKKQSAKDEGQTKQNEKKIEEKSNEIMDLKKQLYVLTQENLQKFDLGRYKKQIKSKNEFSERVSLCCDLVQAVSTLNQLQYTFFPSNLQDLLSIKSKQIKIAIHTSKLWRTIREQQISEIASKEAGKFKKQNMINPSLRYVSPQFQIKSVSIKDIRQNDIWKTGILLITLLTGDDLSKDVLSLHGLDQAKMKQFKLIDQSKMSKMKKYPKNDDVNEIMKTVSLLPSDRPPLKGLIQVFKRLKQQLTEYINADTLRLAKLQYCKQRQLKTFKYMPELKANEQLLTSEHKKKIVQYFKTNQNRPVKDFKLQYRASQTQFSCKSFYQVVYDKKEILIIICQKLNNKKIIVFSQEAFDLSKCNGIFGGYIKDQKKLSFIYSPQENEFCKLKNAERAIGVSYIQGPIIGDGDLVISDGAIYNTSKFPASYESIKLKRLFKTEKFEIVEYDVYQVLF